MHRIISKDVARALEEDVGSGDVTSLLIPHSLHVHASLYTREALLMCGIPWFVKVFSEVDPSITLHWTVTEGSWVDKPGVLCRIEGCARNILTAERAAINFLQILSGTATKTYHYVQALKGSKTQILDTRKTIPGLRLAQKYAVKCAGGVNHRFGLYDQFLIKENHVKACGSITQAILTARFLRPELFLEVEVETLEEFDEAVAASPDRILLDNFKIPMIHEAVKRNQGKIPLEISGGVSLDSVVELGALGVEYISVGDITKSVQAIDFSLLIEEYPLANHGSAKDLPK